MNLPSPSTQRATPAGKAMFQMMGVFAEFERAMVRIGFHRCSAEFQFPSPSLKAVTVQTGIVLSSAFVVSRPNCSSIPDN